MKVVLNRDIKNLGKVGDVVTVKNGYGRNFLLPKKYAVVATNANLAELQQHLEELKQKNIEIATQARKVADLLSKSIYNVVRQAADDDTLYGSIRNKDVYYFVKDLIKTNNIDFSLEISGVKIKEPIKSLGYYIATIELFGDITEDVRINVCRTSADFEDDIGAFDKKRNLTLTSTKENGAVVASEPTKNNNNQQADA